MSNRKLQLKLESLANKYSLPSIIIWKQGRFIDQPKYTNMSDEWKNEQQLREQTLIRPHGGNNNALFQVCNSNANGEPFIAAYLDELGELLKEEIGL